VQKAEAHLVEHRRLLEKLLSMGPYLIYDPHGHSLNGYSSIFCVLLRTVRIGEVAFRPCTSRHRSVAEGSPRRQGRSHQASSEPEQSAHVQPWEGEAKLMR
jgi:hypothetical protein